MAKGRVLVVEDEPMVTEVVGRYLQRTGELRPEFVPESTTGGPGDKIHPNRVGYLAMGMAIDLSLLAR